MAQSSLAGGDDSRIVQMLHKIAAIGNRLPDPVTLFFIIAVAVVAASALFAGMEVDGVMVPAGDGEFTEGTVTVANLLTAEGIQWMYLNAIDNFVNFAPLGPVLMVMLGIGIAERTGLISVGLRMMVMSVPDNWITATLIFACVMSSMAADAGYVVMIPLGGMIFAGLGRHPIAGIAAAFAGVSAGFSANLLLTGLDPMLAEITNEAAQTMDPEYQVMVTANYYFLVVSTFVVTAVGTLVTNRVVEPMLGEWDPSQASQPVDKSDDDSDDGSDDQHPGGDGPRGTVDDGGDEAFSNDWDSSTADEPVADTDEPTDSEKRNFWVAMGVAALVTVFIAFLGIWEGSPLRDLTGQADTTLEALQPYFQRLDVLIMLLFFLPGLVYGVLNGEISNDKDVADMASDTMAAMGAYVVLAFPAGQFIAYFDWTNLDIFVADLGVQVLNTVGAQGLPLLIAFVIVSGIINLFIGSASAKWAVMGPVFVPMLMGMGLSPELVQAAYRVGDSVTNIITPLMPYLPIIIVFAKKYVKDIEIGTLLTVMLPYSVALGIAWTLLLVIWIVFGIPVGPGAEAFIAA